MSEPRKITVDDMLTAPTRSSARLTASADADYYARILFGEALPVRSRFDPRRLIDRLRKPPPPPLLPGGAIVYSDATTDDLYVRRD